MIQPGTNEWLADFRARHGRPLRVLHIGNIANNAYRNASIQRRAGIEADVVCYDYYHIMGCPEWEDADLRGTYDAFIPDWWTLDAGGWQRPSWFVQGPLLLCLAFLAALQTGDRQRVRDARLALVAAYAAVVDGTASANGRPPRDIMAAAHRAATDRIAPELRPDGTGWFNTRSRTEALQKYARSEWHKNLVEQTLSGLLDPALRAERDMRQVHALRDRMTLSAYRTVRRLTGRADTPMRQPASPGYWNPDPSAMGQPLLALRFLVGSAVGYMARPLAVAISKQRSREVPVPAEPAVTLAGDDTCDRLASAYVAANANIATTDAIGEIEAARLTAARWRPLLSYYDIVQGYSVDAAWPLLAGHPHVTAYEHGTIRDIPFEDAPRGRLCRFTYAHVARALITNTDVLPSADRIPIAKERRILMPHAFDDKRLQDFRAQHPAQPRSDTGIVLFSPTRHHWLTPDPSLNKGNDVFLRGVSEVIAGGADIRIVLVDWGQHLPESRELIEHLGIARAVTWVPIMNRTELWSAMTAAHAVADQFTLPALGGVGYESLTLGLRLITNIDSAVLARFFGETPPVFVAANATDVAQRVREIVADPRDLKGVGAAGAAWAERYHSTARVLDLQIAGYREMIVERTAAAT